MLYYTSRVHEKQTIAPDFFFERQTGGILKRSTKKLRKPPTLFLFLTKIPTRLFVFNSDTVASVTPFPLFASFTPAHHYRSTHETDYLVRFYHTIPYHTVPYHTLKQGLLTRAKKKATDLMFLVDKADQEANQEAAILKGMQQETADADEAAFDNRVVQRQKLIAKREVALQVTISDRWKTYMQ